MPHPSPSLRLWLYGTGMLLVAGAFAWRYPLSASAGVLTDIGKLSAYAGPEFVGYVIGVVAMFGLYLLALRETRRLAGPEGLGAIFGVAALLMVGMYWMYPVNATDMYIYAARSRVLTAYGANPLAVPFANFPADPWAGYITSEWSNRVSPYGPLWNLIAAPVTALAGDQVLVALVGFKLMMALCLLLSGWVIVRAAQAAGGNGATGALFYLWNPLVLWEGVGNGHNDVVVMLPLLLGLWAWAARRDTLVLPLLVLAGLIKYVTLPILPLAALALWRRAPTWPARARLLGWSAGLSAATTALALAPFFDLGAVLGSITQQGTLFYTSPASAIIALLDDRYPFELLARWTTRVGTGLLLVALVWQAVVVWRRPERLGRACFEVLFVFILVAAWNSRPWYLIWLAGIAAVLPWGWPAWRTIAWATGGMASYALMIWIEAWWQPGYDTMQIVAVPVMLGGAVLLTLAEAAAWAAGRRRALAAAASY